MAALATASGRTSGRYVERDREVSSSPESYDAGRARLLWVTSADLAGIAA